MLYAAMTFWLLVIVFAAYGVFRLWAGLVKPRLINSILLPGTLVAQLGHVLGLLITGGTVNNTSLIKNDDDGAPATDGAVKTRIPVLGPIITALLPILACGLCIYFVVATIGQGITDSASQAPAELALPTSVNSFWELLRSAIALAEAVAGAILSSDFNRWQTWLFVYLVICLTVRMAPLPGMQRGAIGAILLLGVCAAVVGVASPRLMETTINGVWDTLSFAAGSLLILMIVSLLIRGVVGFIRILANRPAG